MSNWVLATAVGKTCPAAIRDSLTRFKLKNQLTRSLTCIRRRRAGMLFGPPVSLRAAIEELGGPDTEQVARLIGSVGRPDSPIS